MAGLHRPWRAGLEPDPNCSHRKRRHFSRAAAKLHARSLRQQGHHVRPYFHPECGAWHVGHLDYPTMRGRRAGEGNAS